MCSEFGNEVTCGAHEILDGQHVTLYICSDSVYHYVEADQQYNQIIAAVYAQAGTVLQCVTVFSYCSSQLAISFPKVYLVELRCSNQAFLQFKYHVPNKLLLVIHTKVFIIQHILQHVGIFQSLHPFVFYIHCRSYPMNFSRFTTVASQ